MNLNGKRLWARKRTWERVGRQYREGKRVRPRSGQLGVPGKGETGWESEESKRAYFVSRKRHRSTLCYFSFFPAQGRLSRKTLAECSKNCRVWHMEVQEGDGATREITEMGK